MKARLRESISFLFDKQFRTKMHAAALRSDVYAHAAIKALTSPNCHKFFLIGQHMSGKTTTARLIKRNLITTKHVVIDTDVFMAIMRLTHVKSPQKQFEPIGQNYLLAIARGLTAADSATVELTGSPDSLTQFFKTIGPDALINTGIIYHQAAPRLVKAAATLRYQHLERLRALSSNHEKAMNGNINEVIEFYRRHYIKASHAEIHAEVSLANLQMQVVADEVSRGEFYGINSPTEPQRKFRLGALEELRTYDLQTMTIIVPRAARSNDKTSGSKTIPIATYGETMDNNHEIFQTAMTDEFIAYISASPTHLAPAQPITNAYD